MHVCGTHFTNFFRIIEEFAKSNKTEEELIDLLVDQSEPTEFYWKNIRAFHQLANADLQQILKEDPAFNPFFIT